MSVSANAPLIEVRDLGVRLNTSRGPAQAVRGVSFSLKRGETLGLVGESGCGKSVTALALMGLLPDSAVVSGVRAHQHAAGAKKRGLKIRRSLARSRGGLSTKIHLAVRGLGCPVRFTLTAGQKGDAPQAAALIEGLPAEVVMADTAYDADHLRQAIAAKGALAVIPNNPSRALKYPLDKHLYAQRHLVEFAASQPASKRPPEFRAVVTLAAIILWMR